MAWVSGGFTVGPLVGDGRMVPQGRVPPAGIIPPLDPVEQLPSRLLRGVKATALYQLRFERGEERLRHGVVEGVSDRAHGAGDPQQLAAVGEGLRGILAALIGMVDDAGRLP